MKPKKEEFEIIGKWIKEGERVVQDDSCKRIEWLKSNYLQEITTDSTGWDTLYSDPEDGRLWELIYPVSEMHGGGPPVLKCISQAAAKNKYGGVI